VASDRLTENREPQITGAKALRRQKGGGRFTVIYLELKDHMSVTSFIAPMKASLQD
jgi:hypothetical protein